MEVLLGALAEAIIALLMEDLSQRPRLAALRDKLRGDAPEKLALQHALAQSYRAFAEKYPDLAYAFFDEHFLQQPAVVGELAKLLTPDQTPSALVLSHHWGAQFQAPPTVEINAELDFLLKTLASAIKSQPALKPFIDSGALEQLYLIAAQASEQIGEQRATNELLQEIRRLLAEAASLLSTQTAQVHIKTGGGGVVGRDVKAEHDAIIRDKIINNYHIYNAPRPQAPSEATPMPTPLGLTNPFASRGRINDPQLFFGRQRTVREVRQALANGNSIALIGASETGKSSLLFYLYLTRQAWLPDHEVIYLDLQKVLDEKDFCQEILQVLTTVNSVEPRTVTDALRTLKRAFSGRKVLLILDEIERLTQRDFTSRLQGLLRALVQDRNLTLLVASEHPLPKLFPPSDPTSPLHNVFNSVDLPHFTLAETYDFLRQRLATTGVIFDDQELQGLWEISQGYPGQVQRAAETLFNHKMGKS